MLNSTFNSPIRSLTQMTYFHLITNIISILDSLIYMRFISIDIGIRTKRVKQIVFNGIKR